MEDLTVWRRRTTPLPAPPTLHPVLCCDACGAPAALRPKEGLVLRRCRFCRLACYCSAACAAAGAEDHAAYHRVKLIGVQRPLDFEGRDYFDVVCK